MEETIKLIHDHMLKWGEFSTPGALAKRVGFDRSTVSVAFREGLARGWYETRPSPTYINPQTKGPTTEYRAVPRSGKR